MKPNAEWLAGFRAGCNASAERFLHGLKFLDPNTGREIGSWPPKTTHSEALANQIRNLEPAE